MDDLIYDKIIDVLFGEIDKNNNADWYLFDSPEDRIQQSAVIFYCIKSISNNGLRELEIEKLKDYYYEGAMAQFTGNSKDNLMEKTDKEKLLIAYNALLKIAEWESYGNHIDDEIVVQIREAIKQCNPSN